MVISEQFVQILNVRTGDSHLSLPMSFGQEYILESFSPIDKNYKISLSASIYRTDVDFRIVFTLHDPLELIIIPFDKREKERSIGLWENTCFEVFITDNQKAYAEGNFALDFGWNIFWFNEYRENPIKEFQPSDMKNPIRDIYLSGKKSQIIIDLPNELTNKFNIEEIRFSLTAVLKTKNKTNHFFALKHSDKMPNFHHRDSFLRFK